MPYFFSIQEAVKKELRSELSGYRHDVERCKRREQLLMKRHEEELRGVLE